MTGAVKCTVMYAFFRLVIFIILLADVSILPTGYFELNLFAYCFDMAVASYLLNPLLGDYPYIFCVIPRCFVSW